MSNQSLFLKVEELFVEDSQFCSKPQSSELLRLVRGSIQIPKIFQFAFSSQLCRLVLFPYDDNFSSEFHDFISWRRVSFPDSHFLKSHDFDIVAFFRRRKSYHVTILLKICQYFFKTLGQRQNSLAQMVFMIWFPFNFQPFLLDSMIHCEYLKKLTFYFYSFLMVLSVKIFSFS